MIGCIIFIIIFLVGILYTVKNKNKKNELMVSLYDIPVSYTHLTLPTN